MEGLIRLCVVIFPGSFWAVVVYFFSPESWAAALSLFTLMLTTLVCLCVLALCDAIAQSHVARPQSERDRGEEDSSTDGEAGPDVPTVSVGWTSIS